MRNSFAFARTRHAFTPRQRTDIFSVRAAQVARDVSRAPAARPARWAPHGTRIAYSERRRRPGIYVMRADGAHRKRLPRSGALPARSPDGKKIAFVRRSATYNGYLGSACDASRD